MEKYIKSYFYCSLKGGPEAIFVEDLKFVGTLNFTKSICRVSSRR